MMANARKNVKNTSNVGRTGKAGKEAQFVSTCKTPWLVCAFHIFYFKFIVIDKVPCFDSKKKGKGARGLLRLQKIIKSLSRLELVHL